MNKEDKQLLLQDLCARLPYDVYALADTYKTFDGGIIGNVIGVNNYLVYLEEVLTPFLLDEIKPYLRPMSSMTEEEFAEYEKANDLDTIDSSETLKENMKTKSRVRISKWYHGTDWLNAHYFDYRGLIPKGLALPAPEEMYKTK